MQNMIKATDTMPLNFGFTGKGNDSGTNSLRDIIEAGACGLKVHEDWGATPEVIDRALTIADEYDVQVSCLSRWLGSLHTDNNHLHCRSTSTAIPSMKVDTSRVPWPPLKAGLFTVTTLKELVADMLQTSSLSVSMRTSCLAPPTQLGPMLLTLLMSILTWVSFSSNVTVQC